MNRERLLLVGVLAILALWYFVLREKQQPVTAATPKKLVLKALRVPSSEMPYPQATIPDPPPFTLVTNEAPHPRPIRDARFMPAARDLPNVWPPTSRSVGIQLLGRLRRLAVPAPADDKATLTLPALSKSEEAGSDKPTEDRLDQWESFGRLNKGRILAIRVKGTWLRPARAFPAPGELPPFERMLAMLEADPQRAQQEGARDLEVKFVRGGTAKQTFPDEINAVKAGASGKQAGWYHGARTYLRLPAKGMDARRRAGNQLLEKGTEDNDKDVLGWALKIFDEARQMVPDGAQNQLREVLLLQLASANALNMQERVLELGFDHLSRFQQDAAVLEYMGNIVASRSYGLYEIAIRFYERARASKDAQRKRAALLIRMGRYEEAGELLDSGAAGTSVAADLLRARVALAQGDFDTASTRAGRHTSGGGAVAAEASQILGGAAYAQGDAAKAAERFQAAVDADPARSSAYSDLGLALAVQGKLADARLCFERAVELDFENSVVPRLGAVFADMTLGLSDAPLPKEDPEDETARRKAALDRAKDELGKLLEANPRNIGVRYFVAYGKEKTGDLDGAAKDYRGILDEDHRYRVAIARLGIVEAQRREAGGPESLVRPAIAHLYKAAELNPKDGTVAYILARFLMREDMRRQDADRYFDRAQKLPAPAGDPDLPLWAQAARASLMYRDESVDELKVRAAYNNAINLVRRQGTRTGATDANRYVADHPVGQYATGARDFVSENANKVDIRWTFKTEPKDWSLVRKLPMRVGVTRNGLEFRGRVDFQGKEIDHNTRLEYCSVEYKDRALSGNTFFELHVTGVVPASMDVDFGIGLIGQSKTRRLGRRGIQIKRSAATEKPELRLEGGNDIEVVKRDRANNYLEMTNLSWPKGEFKLVIRVTDREKGLFKAYLNGTELISGQYGEKHADGARASVFGRGGRGSRPISIVAWVEGPGGTEFSGIYIKEVKLVRAGKAK
ncbi:MAG: tetratricopeptide repeat protein [Planctomycetota bacterium]